MTEREILVELLRNPALARCLLRAVGVFDNRAIVVQPDPMIGHVGKMVVFAIGEATAEAARERGQLAIGPAEIPPIADDDETRAPLAILDAIVHARPRTQSLEARDRCRAMRISSAPLDCGRSARDLLDCDPPRPR